MKMNRNLYRIFLLVTFLALNALILFGVTSALTYLNTGADRTSMLHLHEEISASYLPKVQWEIAQNEGRPMETQTLGEIERDYLSAWQVRNAAYANNLPYGVADYYTDSMRTELFKITELNLKNKVSLQTTTLEHHPKLEFYSTDGKLVVFTDKNVSAYEEVYHNETLVAKRKLLSDYKVMLLLEDGFWRVRHLVENTLPKTEKQTIPKVQNLKNFHFKGINYYPQNTPWDMFGDKFDISIIEHDFKLMAKMGINSLRIFIPYESFGKEHVDQEKIQKVKLTLDMAEKSGLDIMPTLFDFYGNYSINDWTMTNRHVEQVVESLKDHKAIIAWDVKNEPDLDFESRGKERVLAWLEQTVERIRSIDPERAITIGWASPEAAVHLKDQLELVSFHYYRGASEFEAAFTILKNKVTDKPLLLQEYGYSSYDGIWNAFSGSDEKQKAYIETIQKVVEKEKLSHMIWTLYDFKNIPTSVVGRLPWRKVQQRHFGLLDSQGRKKPVYDIFINKGLE
ncbi:glycoside hydrolase family 2 TIM barrel-domain containing protein [Zobellia galactanivorans]|uniref:glycoside hydrolase family 2 TIM barrel-domain containing protein n=1 Tax=Zobellia galactanivorans (strain DSM 12802 / CCUG 47099 / CIP 106680 / NCIMB 13871 / Dsij) TaxID=63186 RepID=UPI001C073EE6|nr:glycoside hydrolase family 2 TIM barrel-domain containing protein [Zobellia galactanivorans]MBU3025102.1 cellulase family glycosylhydrolase [Zobellia galactanivorans]